MYQRPTLYIPFACGVGGLLFLTLINYVFYPVALRLAALVAVVGNCGRAWYSCTGKLSPKVEILPSETGDRYEVEETHILAKSTKSVYEGTLYEGAPLC